ncbi:MAG TPA: hypothetical protein EYG92_10040 [Lutibacter sp.]|nr:hypothetical protein [Lutibacter sp.]
MLETVDTFLEKIFQNLESAGINVYDFELDHICYRVETLQRYNESKKDLEKKLSC